MKKLREEGHRLGRIIGKRIKAIREKKGISRTELVKLLDGLYSYDAVYKLEERGVDNPPITVIAKIADILGVSVDELIRQEEPSLREEVLQDPDLTILMYQAKDLSKKDKAVILQVIEALKNKDAGKGKGE